MKSQRREVLLIHFDADSADRLTAVARALGFSVGAVTSPADAEILLEARRFQLLIAAAEDANQLLAEARGWKQRMRFVEIVGVLNKVPEEVPAPLFDVMRNPLPADNVIRSVLQRTMRYQNAVERNAMLFRRLQASLQRIEALEQRVAVVEAENRLLQRAVEDRPSLTPDRKPQGEVLTSARLQRFFESLAESFNKALDSMLFYSSQVLLQSDGSDAALALSRWIEREVDELRSAYEGLIQDYYTELVEEDAPSQPE